MIYTHKEKGGDYEIIELCSLKGPEGEWVNGIIYRGFDENKCFTGPFVRSLESFQNKFKIRGLQPNESK